MSTTELDEVQALLEQVLPDPAGYAQRLALQLMTRWGLSARSTDGATDSSTAAQDITRGAMVITPDQPSPNDLPVDTNLLLAAALGACECWGLQADCESCRGYGSSGWTQPHPQLFEEFVQPAIARLSDRFDGDHNQDGGMRTRKTRSTIKPRRE